MLQKAATDQSCREPMGSYSESQVRLEWYTHHLHPDLSQTRRCTYNLPAAEGRRHAHECWWRHARSHCVLSMTAAAATNYHTHTTSQFQQVSYTLQFRSQVGQLSTQGLHGISLRSLVGPIQWRTEFNKQQKLFSHKKSNKCCLLYTSDAADE